ncbi:hypothetical protein C8R47DRAFT_1162784 [Mycena vitilis]|nr:hypothetical protein C8R47DRAFT_1162784 [Mycena vitilis]
MAKPIALAVGVLLLLSKSWVSKVNLKLPSLLRGFALRFVSGRRKLVAVPCPARSRRFFALFARLTGALLQFGQW